MTDHAATRRPPDLPERVTMPLLTLITQGAVDEDYVHAARRRERAGDLVREPGGSSLRRHLGAVAVVAAFGLLIAIAAVQNSRNASADSESRDALIKRIEIRKSGVAAQERQIGDLRRQTSELQRSAGGLSESLRATQSQLTSLQVATGFVAVSGPGLSISVDDSRDGSADGRVRASDLRLLVNGLWAAGAEAVEINERRLTTLSSIVNAGISVQVNRLPTSPPYVVTAIGDAGDLATHLARTSTGATFQGLADEFGFVVQRQNVSSVTMASAPGTQLPLRSAQAIPPSGPSAKPHPEPQTGQVPSP